MVQNLKWATAHLSRRLGAGALGAGALGRAGVGAGALGWALGTGREGVWQALGVRGRAGGRCRQLGARAQGATGLRSWPVRGRRSARRRSAR